MRIMLTEPLEIDPRSRKEKELTNRINQVTELDCGPLDATNASKYLIDQSEDRILQINQSKNALKHS